MFSTKEQLIKKTGKYGVGRLSYLEQLITEYKTTKSRDAKEQVLANLANFAYDPVNYEYLWRLKVLDVFFGALDEDNKKLVSFGIGGICNICLDPLSRQYIIRNNGIQRISSFLSKNEETWVLSAITILIYLDTPKTRELIVLPDIVERMIELSKSTNRRIENLAKIFLKTLCNIKFDESNSSTITNTSAHKQVNESTSTTKYSKDKRIIPSAASSSKLIYTETSASTSGESSITSCTNIDDFNTANNETTCTSASESESDKTIISSNTGPSTSTGKF